MTIVSYTARDIKTELLGHPVNFGHSYNTFKDRKIVKLDNPRNTR